MLADLAAIRLSLCGVSLRGARLVQASSDAADKDVNAIRETGGKLPPKCGLEIHRSEDSGATGHHEKLGYQSVQSLTIGDGG